LSHKVSSAYSVFSALSRQVPNSASGVKGLELQKASLETFGRPLATKANMENGQ